MTRQPDGIALQVEGLWKSFGSLEVLRGINLELAEHEVVACIGATREGQLMNVNADTLAAHLAAALGARRLVIAGGTSGVLDEQGGTIVRLTSRDAMRMIKAGTANKGMVAKLQACTTALKRGVGDVLIANGRTIDFDQLAAARQAQGGTTQVVMR